MFKSVRFPFVLMCSLYILTGAVWADDITAPGDAVVGVPNDNDWPSNESPNLAIDDEVTTKYLHFKGAIQSTGFRVTPSAGTSVVTGLTFTTANDAPERDPVAFELYGSNKDIAGPYTLIASGQIPDFDRAEEWPRHTINDTPISFDNDLAYAHYQILFTSVRHAARANSMQIAEVEFLATPVGGQPPEVDAGDDRTITWQGAGRTVLQLQPTIVDDDPCGLAQTDPDYLTCLWSSVDEANVDFLGTETTANAQVLFPEAGVYALQLQVWDEADNEGSDTVVITVVEPDRPIGDLSGDAKVDFSDITALAAQWLDEPGCVDGPFGCADLTGNDGVDLLDVALLAQNWREDWTGALRVTIQPDEAIEAGAQWRLSDGSWRQSGERITDLVSGSYTVQFSDAGDWVPPSDKTVQVQRSQTSTVEATYVELNTSALVISEFMTSNEMTISTVVSGQTVYPDWIEIYNSQTETMDLNGWYLTDDPDDPTQWAFPPIQIAPGSSLLLFASGVQEEDHPGNWPYVDDAGYYHTNFKLDRDGGYLALIAPNEEIAHQYGSADDGQYPVLETDTSYGLYEGREQYYTEPSPGQANDPGYAGISAEPVFSHDAGAYLGYLFLEISSTHPNAVIRYTTNGEVPDENSTQYTGNILLLGNTEVIARVYEPDKAPSAPVSRTYMFVTNDLSRFNSDLPIVLIGTQNRSITSGTFRRVHAAIIDVHEEEGRAEVLDPVNFVGRGGLKVRGSSTSGAPKRQYSFEIWDQYDRDRDVSLLDMPAESDWILYAPLIFDRALINNALAYEVSNQVGRYAVRTRFCEMYLSSDDTFSASDYVGLYILMEKIKRGPDRVNVEKLEPDVDREPALTGGYMLKIDRADPGDRGFRTSRGNPTYGDGTLCYVDPKEEEITDVQSAWIRGYLDDFETALYGTNSAHPQTGYAQYIDVDSWVDHNLLNMLFMNVDALRLSTFIHKKRNGKLEMGPLWDFDRAMDSTDGRDNNPESWHGTGDGTDYLNYVWWNELFEDVNFWQKYIDRWYQLRNGGPFDTTEMNATIDAMADEIREAQARNYAKWSSYGPRYGGFQGEIDHLKDWLETRSTWIDDQFVAPPMVTPDGGQLENPGTIEIVNPHDNGTIYYTLDGSDPRVPIYDSVVVESDTLVSDNATKYVLVPMGPVDDAWRESTTFDDSAWVTGTGGVGYERSMGYEAYFDIDVFDQMHAITQSCYIRIPFVFSGDTSAYNTMTLLMRFDDGFVAYLNGVEIARAQFNGTPAWNSGASGSHSDVDAIYYQEFDISTYVNLLQSGSNLLAIHGLNSGTTSSDFLINAQLVAGQSVDPTQNGLAETAMEYTGPIVLAQSTQIKARVLVNSNAYSPWSGLAEPTFSVGPVAESLRISEIMYHPADFGSPDDPNTEYIELTNIGNETINLNLVAFTNGVDFTFGSVELAPGDYTLVVRDIAAFGAKYGVGLPIAGQYRGNLSNGGEKIELQDAAGTTIHAFSFKDNWYDTTDGGGFSLTVKAPATVDPNALGDKASWRPSAFIDGSPGYGDAGDVTELGAVVINEVMANPDTGQSDWIELYNTTDRAIGLGGWFLSDDGDELTKYEIDADVTIPAGGYVVFYQDTDFAFGLSRNGETVYLSSGLDGVLTGYLEEEKFDASETGVSMGRYRKSTGAYNFVPLNTPTPGAANAEPNVGPVVISEIMYNWPLSDEVEYVELLNISDTAVTLYDVVRDAPWRFTDDPDDPGIEFLFPTDDPVVLQPGQYLLLAKDAEALNQSVAVSDGVQVLEWTNGRLSNGSEKIQLSKPGDEDDDGTRNWIRVDRVVYSDGAHGDNFADGIDPWPAEADGMGLSLRRIDTGAYGNDPINWQAASASPGSAN